MCGYCSFFYVHIVRTYFQKLKLGILFFVLHTKCRIFSIKIKNQRLSFLGRIHPSSSSHKSTMNSLTTCRRLLRPLSKGASTTATRSIATLQETLAAQVPAKQTKLATLKKEHGSKVIGKVTIDQLIGGARGVKCMLWETSNLDAEEGIRFRGLTIPECQQVGLMCD